MELQLGVWNAERYRFSAFRVPGVPFDAEQAWSRIAETPAEEVTRKPAAGIEQHQARINDAQLLLNVEIGRVDLIYYAVQPDEMPGFTAINRFEESRGFFEELVQRWLRHAPPITRIAYGATLLEPADTRVLAYTRLAHFLRSVQIEPETSSDFYYQINRFITSNAIPGLIVNRLSKWAVQKVALFLAQAVAEQGSLSNILREDQAIRLELDISSDGARSDALPHEALANLFSELTQAGALISARGDPL